MEPQKLGSELRALIKGLLGDSPDRETAAAILDSNPVKRTAISSPVTSSVYQGEKPRDLPSFMKDPVLPERPRAEDITLMPNARAQLRRSSFLLGVQKDNSVYTLDPATGRVELVARFENTPMLLWRAVPMADSTFYCVFSGTRWPGYPTEVAFGMGGAILHVDHHRERVHVVPGVEDLKDPAELVVLEDGSIIVLDFGGFGGTSSINRLDPRSGDREILAEGDPLCEAVAAFQRPGTDKLLIANSFMRYSSPTGPGGKPLKEFGAILEFDLRTRQFSVLYDESQSPKGAIDSLAICAADPEKVIFSRNDWPTQETAGVFELDLSTGTVRAIVESTSDYTVFERVAAASDTHAFIVDSYQKLLLSYNLTSGSVDIVQPLSTMLGPSIGMVSPLDTVESARPIP